MADTGGVIGVWPNAADYPSLDAMAEGIKLLADAVGIAHIGLGTDMLGFIRPPVFDSYAQLPALADAPPKSGFTPAEVGQILGGNYRRVFEAAVG
ncbi:membrane dipeptidase [Ralstonia pseudosolanacearum]|uniref:membrane dipeptidase n=1 Tax=Ralstonia pseudosolanacearum TaxID=1310165 RepID=UPI0033977D1C